MAPAITGGTKHQFVLVIFEITLETALAFIALPVVGSRELASCVRQLRADGMHSVFTIAARKEIVQGVVSVKITKTIAIEAAFYIINAFTSNIS